MKRKKNKTAQTPAGHEATVQVPAPAGSRTPQLLFAAVLLTAAFTRLYKINYDLPEVVWADSFKFIDQAARMAARGDFQPTLLQYPGLYPGLLAIIYRVLDITGRAGQVLAGHYLTALSGVAAVAAVWLLASRLGGVRARFAAAALTALCLPGVVYSRTCSTDWALATFMACSLALLAAPPAGLWGFAAAGALAGLAAGTKFTGLFLLPFLAASAAWSGWRDRSWKKGLVRGGVGLTAALAIFLITTPHFLPLVKEYGHRIRLEAQYQGGGMVGQVNGSPLDLFFSRTPAWETPMLGTSLAANVGWPALLLAAAAAALALAGRCGPSALFLAACLVCYLCLLVFPGHIKTPRFQVPALPVMFALTGAFLAAAADRFGRWRHAAFAVLLGAALFVPGMKIYGYLSTLSHPSTNTLARQWAKENIPPDSMVFIAPFYTNDLLELPFRFFSIEDAGKRLYGRPYPGVPPPEVSPPYTAQFARDLKEGGVRYLVMNSYFNGAFSPAPENLAYFPAATAGYAAFMKELESGAELIWSAPGNSAGRMGPDIAIYRFK